MRAKTLTATLAVYLNALAGRGVCVVTVNDYLAGRDAQWMGRLYSYLGLTVGMNRPQASSEENRPRMARTSPTAPTTNTASTTCATTWFEARDRVQRGLQLRHRGRVDSILIDEAHASDHQRQAEDHTAICIWR